MVIIPKWVYEREVAKNGREAADKIMSAYGAVAVSDWSEVAVNWTEIYKDAVRGAQLLKGDLEWPVPAPPLEGAKMCRPIPCPGSYFPHHDDQCEMVWDEEDQFWTNCFCEPRARAVRDAS